MKPTIRTESRNQEATDWVPAGIRHTAYFEHEPEGLKGCPLGRSMESPEKAVRDLLSRANWESGLSLTLDTITIL